MCQPSIRLAVAAEAQSLSDLAFRSKAHWGYSPRFMKACREELGVSRSLIRTQSVFVLEVDESIAGFFSLEGHPNGQVELGHLFVDPKRIGLGFGACLLQRACKEAVDRGFERLIIQGDPNAEGFYLRCGAIRVGEQESSSIPGRNLPLFEITLG